VHSILPEVKAFLILTSGCIGEVTRRDAMDHENLIRPDLLSEVILLSFGGVIVAALALVVVTAIFRA